MKCKLVEIFNDKLELNILSHCHRQYEINYLKTNSLNLQEKKFKIQIEVIVLW